MGIKNHFFAQALRARHFDVFLAQDFQHGAARLADVASRHGDGQYDGRLEQMFGDVKPVAHVCVRVHTARRKPFQPDGEQIDRDERQKEGRDAGADEGQAGGEVIPQGIRLARGQNAQNDADEDGQRQRDARQQKGGADALADYADDFRSGAVGITEASLEQTPQPLDVLNMQRLIQPHADVERLDVRRGHLRRDHCVNGRARRQIGKQKHQNCHSEEDGNHDKNAFEQEFFHNRPPVFTSIQQFDALLLRHASMIFITQTPSFTVA